MASAAEKISFTCPNCAKVLVASSRPAADAKVTCPACSHSFVPEIEEIETHSTGVKSTTPSKADPDDAPRSKKSRDDDEDDDRPKKKKSRSDADDEDDDDRPRRKKKSRAADDDEDDDDPRPPRKRRRYEDDDDDDVPIKKKKKRKAGSNNVVLFVVIIGGLAVVLLSFLACGIGAYFLISRATAARQSFTVNNLPPGRWEERNFNFKEGRRITVEMTSTTTHPATDVDLYVLRGNFGENIVALDITIGPDGRVTFVAPATDVYRIRVVNLGPGVAQTSRVNITEH
jgi:hypothetical protein